jgi:hypothetical protein
MIGLVLAAAVSVQAPAILGQRVGYPVELPQCPEPFDFFNVKNDCWMPAKPEEDVGINKGVRMLELSEATLQKGDFVKDATITVEDDVVVAMYIRTSGVSGQDEALSALTPANHIPHRSPAKSDGCSICRSSRDMAAWGLDRDLR